LSASSCKIGEQLTTHLQDIAKANPLLNGIINRVDFNATTHGQRDIDDDRLSNLIEAISAKPLGLADVEPDIIGRSYEYLIRKFAEGSGENSTRRRRSVSSSLASWTLSRGWISTIRAAAQPDCSSSASWCCKKR
jgi:type I restriction-modification system DNA methylase subunit